MPRLRPSPRSTGRLLAIAALAAGSAGLLSACGDASTPVPPPLAIATIDAALATTPTGLTPAARKLERAANTLLPGDGDDAGTQLDRQLAALRGTPVVVNLWGDWCLPCKKEIPVFQRATLELRGKVVFLGVATRTSRGKTESFLAKKLALPYPSIYDPDEQVNNRAGVASVPKTLFYKAGGGEPFVHLGSYTSVAKLRDDIEQYTR